MKTCKECLIEKSSEDFYKYIDGSLRGRCKVCLKIEDKKRRDGVEIKKVKHTPWNKGKTNIYSDETLNKMGSRWRDKKVPTEIVEKRRESLRKGSARKSYKGTEWTRKVKENNNWACIYCGENNKNKLHAHHIVPWGESVELRFVLSNGVTLCASCHNKEEYKTNKKRQKLWSAGVKFSEEHKKKLSDARKGKEPWNKGLKNCHKAWNKGVPMTEDAKLKLSKSNKGNNKGKSWKKCPETGKRIWYDK